MDAWDKMCLKAEGYDEVVRERDAALDLAERRAAVLRKVEWHAAWGMMCPICDQYDFDGHLPDCELAAALAAAPPLEAPTPVTNVVPDYAECARCAALLRAHFEHENEQTIRELRSQVSFLEDQVEGMKGAAGWSR
jgi:hypothetical protein